MRAGDCDSNEQSADSNTQEDQETPDNEAGGSTDASDLPVALHEPFMEQRVGREGGDAPELEIGQAAFAPPGVSGRVALRIFAEHT